MAESSQFFEGKGAVQETLRAITQKLDELGIPYAVAGGLALFAHGYRRFTEDVDILVTQEGLATIHEKLEGLGYISPFPASKSLRDASTKVKIEFLVTGGYPGDGKPKPVAFPNPASASVELDGIRFLNLSTLINLKLASGMTAPHRIRDLSDVLELIKALSLPEGLAADLAEFVRAKYLELWALAQTPTE